MELPWHLSETDFFDGLSEEKRDFLSLSKKRPVKKNEIIFFAEDPGSAAFYLKSGEVRIFRISSLGKECIVFVRRSGEMFGLAEVMSENKRKCTAQALTDCLLYEIRKEDFETLLSRHHNLSKRVIEVLGRRIRYLSEQIENLMSCNVNTRLLKILVYLSFNKLTGADALNEPTVVPVRLTQEQLAAMTGSCQQTVSETMKQLEQEGLIRMSGKEIILLKPSEAINRIV